MNDPTHGYGAPRIDKPDWSEDQHVLYNFTIEAIFPMLNASGVFIIPSPSPLTVEQITEVFTVIAESDHHKSQRISTRTIITGDDSVIAVHLNADGTVTTETLPWTKESE